MPRKIYEHRKLTYLSTNATVDGKKVNIVFEGGSKNNPQKVTAKLVTDNKEVQDDIENRKDFGREIFLIYEEKPIEPIDPDKPKEIGIPEGFTEIKGITTGVEAKNYILEKFPEVKHAELKSIALIKEVATKNKIIFSELI